MTDLLILLPFIVVPGIALAFVRPPVRRIVGAIGLVVGLVAEWLIGGRADNFGGVLPFAGFGLAAAALLGEALAFLIHLIRGRGHSAPDGNA